MSGKEIVDIILRVLELFTQWPFLLFLLIMLFRKKIIPLIFELLQRIESISFGDAKVVFENLQGLAANNDPLQLKQMILNTKFNELIKSGESDFVDEDDNSEESELDEDDMDEADETEAETSNAESLVNFLDDLRKTHGVSE